MKRVLTRWTVQATLRALALIARRPALEPASKAATRALAALAVRSKRIRPTGRLADLGPLWQRAFPSPAQVPIERVSEDTVYASIHTPCPLRGTGDLQACHRMMEFDREVLRRAGGQFVVLESQAEPGVRHCRVAMRLKGRSLDGLVPAIERRRSDRH
jgi:hypothetical protein